MRTRKKIVPLMCAALLLGIWPAGKPQAAEAGGGTVFGAGGTQQTDAKPGAASVTLAAEQPVWNSNLESVITTSGAWSSDEQGVRGTADGDAPALRMHGASQTEGFVWTGDISPGTADASAGLAFLGAADGSGGYAVLLEREQGRVTARLLGPDGAQIAQSSATYISENGVKHRLQIVKDANGSVRVFVDGYADAAIQADGLPPGGASAGLIVRRGTAVFQDTYLTPEADYYGEAYRPAYHYSPPRGSASDPNGMIFYQGEYHLFHQDGGRWAHAVSTDMLHWKSLPLALEWNSLGHIWSGSAVADPDNVSGLFDASPDGGGMIAYYTSYDPDAVNGNQRIGIAYSSDRGRTWHYPQDRPIVIENPGRSGDNPGGWDFRDPKVVRDEARDRWVMVVSGGDHIRFFVSTNLTDWTLTDNFGYGDYVRGGVWECPDLLPLTVDGTGERKWVLMLSTGANPATEGSDAEYFVGELTDDGKFINDNAAGDVLKTDWGKEFYASSSFTDAPDGRRIVMAWMTNWDYPFAFPTEGWKGVLSLPRELSLTQTPNGLRLAQQPIAELDGLRSELFRTENAVVTEQTPNLLSGLSAGAYEIEAELELPSSGAAETFGFRVRESGGKHTDIGYSVAEQKLALDRSVSGITDFSPLFGPRQETTLQPDNGVVKLRIFVDESSVEVFANNGRTVFSDVIFPNPSQRGLSFYATGGEVKVRSLQVHALESVWKSQTDSEFIVSESKIELGPNDSRTLSAAPRTSSLPAASVNWTSSDPGIVSVEAVANGQARLTAVAPGEATVTAAGANGMSAAARVTVHGGSFRSDLGKLDTAPSSASWIVTEHGLRGSASGDTTAMSGRSAGDFVYEATVKLGESGGAASLLFRADPTGSSGYYLNLDPNMDHIRLFYKMNGNFAERQLIASSPASIVSGGTSVLRVQANGPHIRAWLNGKKVIDVRDGTFAEGRFGLHAFGGQASFQQVRVKRDAPAKLDAYAMVSRESGLTLAAAGSARGSAVGLKSLDAPERPRWTLVPTGSGDGSFSLRTEQGQALDLDTGRGTLQLYDYLGYDNQRWLLRKQGSRTFVLNAANGLALTSASGGALTLTTYDPANAAQSWKLDR
ncbi:GH32 C-terminal domain-containing protein [Saccharibacillus sacchari]|uniref:GH32 C-terminal domain-containing protein n=1 Tax=Saccharibacillus sacchari TaxID=456493 RepID=A0ACC6PHL2_9BACL